MRIEDNADEYLMGVAKMTPDQKRHTLEFINSEDYAETLHNRHGFYVFRDSKHPADLATNWLKEAFDRYGGLTNQHMEMSLAGAGHEEITFLRSYTNELRPPVREGQRVRPPPPCQR